MVDLSSSTKKVDTRGKKKGIQIMTLIKTHELILSVSDLADHRWVTSGYGVPTRQKGLLFPRGWGRGLNPRVVLKTGFVEGPQARGQPKVFGAAG
jgi:hypothetical protein